VTFNYQGAMGELEARLKQLSLELTRVKRRYGQTWPDELDLLANEVDKLASALRTTAEAIRTRHLLP
jgi:hypothetical protein